MSSVRQMGQYIGFSERAIHLMQISALFHDMGYLQNPKEHEERSVEYINPVAKELQLSPTEVQSVGQMILKTHPARRPNNLMQAILKDADLSYLGMVDVERWS